MTAMVNEIVHEATGIVDEVIHDAEELFPPRPGGLVDKHRRRKAEAESARLEGADSAVEHVGRNKVTVFRMADQSAEIASATTLVLTGASALQPILGRDPNRKRAVIIAVDAPIVISTTLAAASDPQNVASAPGLRASGVILPVGVPYVIEHQSEVYAVLVTSPMSAPAGSVTLQGNGAVTNPAASGVIVSTPALTGTYSITTTTYVEGGTTADSDNMKFVFGASTPHLVYPGSVVAPVSRTFVVTLNNQSVQVAALAAASGASAVYHAQIISTPVLLAATSTRVSVSTEVYDPE
jgi:hypothetical protein